MKVFFVERLELFVPSMKVPPKRKGNPHPRTPSLPCSQTLNESPSEKEGKFLHSASAPLTVSPSMKVPPKRKGNAVSTGWHGATS